MTGLLQCTIGSTDVSNRVQKISVTRRSLQGVGNFTIDLWNQDGALNSAFPVDTNVSINLGIIYGGTLYPFFGGYVDKCDLINVQDNNQKIVMTLQVKGRDYGQDLQNKTVWGSDTATSNVGNTLNDLVFNLLYYGASPVPNPLPVPPNPGSSGYPYTNIGYVPISSGESTSALYDSQGRSYLSDVFKRLFGSINWDMYVNLNHNLNYFPVGTISSGISLYELTDNSQNNIVGPVHYQPVDGLELKNVVIAYGGALNDSWTDVGMAQYWTAEGNCMTPTDWKGDESLGVFGFPQVGVGAIKFTNNLTSPNNSGAKIKWGINLPAFFHWYLWYSVVSLATIKWSMYVLDPDGTPSGDPALDVGYALVEPSISLTDTQGNVIKWVFGGQYRFNYWNVFEVPVGWNITTEAQIYHGVSGDPGTATPAFDFTHYDKWVYSTWVSGSFNWKVVNVSFESGAPAAVGRILFPNYEDSSRMAYALMDNLCFGSMQIYAVADHSGTQFHGGVPVPCQICGRSFAPSLYKARQLVLTRNDITYQTNLINYAETIACQRANPVYNPSTGLWTAQTPLSTCTLRADGRAGLISGAWMWWPGLKISLNGSDMWRMIEIEHTIQRNVENTGFDHVVDLSLVPSTMQIDLDQWTYNKYGDVGITRILHDRVTALENTFQLLSPAS